MTTIIVVLTLLAILIIWHGWYTEVIAGVPARKWRVAAGYDNSAEAAERFSRVHARMMRLFRYLRKKYHVDETPDTVAACENHAAAVASQGIRRDMVEKLLRDYNPDRFYENDPRVSSNTSYTIGKGDRLYMCLRYRHDPSRLIDEDTLFFVLLHEAAHIANFKSWGHDEWFWMVFKWLLGEARAAGVYEPVDYEKHPVDFCGLTIYYQPLFDKNLPNIP